MKMRGRLNRCVQSLRRRLLGRVNKRSTQSRQIGAGWGQSVSQDHVNSNCSVIFGSAWTRLFGSSLHTSLNHVTVREHIVYLLVPRVSLGERGIDDFLRITLRAGEEGPKSSSNEKSSQSSSSGDVGKSSTGILGRRLFENGSTEVEFAMDRCL